MATIKLNLKSSPSDGGATSVFGFLCEQIVRKHSLRRYGTCRAYTNAYLRFREFRAGADLGFAALTPDLIESYGAWLADRRLKPNTTRFYLRTLSTMLHHAAERGLVDDRRLFDRVSLTFVKTTKRAISERQVRAIERLPLPEGSGLALARDVFMFSFYTRGMPFVDIAYLRKSDLRYGTLCYCRRKTGQLLTVAWEREQQSIVDRYASRTAGSPYMFPFIRCEDGTEYLQYQRVLENINRNLKTIGRMVGLKLPLTTYVARHSWASIARDMNFSIAVISEGMGHTSYKTTQVYLDSIDTSKINDANRRIIQRIRRGE